MTYYALLPGFAIALTIAATSAVAESAHVHGEGRVNIAIDGDSFLMLLESPGADIVGFEHAARSADEKSAVTTAIAQLSDPVRLLRFDPDANCEIIEANAEVSFEEEEHEEQEEHDHEESHGSFVAEYEFACADMDALDFIEFTYFKQFANAQSLDIVIIDGSGQRSVEIDRANPVLRLAR
jgi:hypothetical protein